MDFYQWLWLCSHTDKTHLYANMQKLNLHRIDPLNSKYEMSLNGSSKQDCSRLLHFTLECKENIYIIQRTKIKIKTLSLLIRKVFQEQLNDQ